MLIKKGFWEPIRAGTVTVIFRAWKTPRVVAGRIYRTGAGRLEVREVEVVERDDISNIDAQRAGFETVKTLLEDLRDEPDRTVYRITIEHKAEPDPRTALANTPALTSDEYDELSKRLDRLDRVSKHGAWTRTYLETIEQHPERRAPDLAELHGRDTQPFKNDIRKLKNLGLTHSHRIGYTLSPRGEAYLRRHRSEDESQTRT